MRIYPTTSPFLPPVGEDFINESFRLGDDKTYYAGTGKTRQVVAGPVLVGLLEDALYGADLRMQVTVKGTKKKLMDVVAGHRWGANPKGTATGPEPCDVMVIGKQLGDNEINRRRCMIGPTGQFLMDSAMKLGAARSDLARWYVTNVIKTANPDDGGSWQNIWVKNFLHLLMQEIALVRPTYILCMGADAVKALLGKSATLGKTEGMVIEQTYDFRKSSDDPPDLHTVHIMGCTHPAAVLRTPAELTDKFELSLARFLQLIDGNRWDRQETDIDHRVVDNERDLEALVAEVKSHGLNNIIGMDAEWHGEHPQNEGAYVRCIQVSWAHKTAACIVLNHPGGSPAFKRIVRKRVNGQVVKKWTTKGGTEKAIELLGQMLEGQRPCGHFFTADLEWLVPLGLDLRAAFAPPDDWQKCKTEGGLDTALMAHAIDETGDFTLTGQTLRYTAAPRYDVELNKWKESYCRKNKIKAKDLEGYGECPPEVLYPYATYDADITRRIAIVHTKNLDSDRFGNNCWEAFWISQRAALAVLEMKAVGVPLDSKRVDELTAVYMEVKAALENRIREWSNWPTLNPNSVYQIRELLFGTEFNGKEPVEGVRPRLRPDDAISLEAVPLLTTEKRQRRWDDLSPEEQESMQASTNKSTLGMMHHQASSLTVRRNGRRVQMDCADIVTAVRDYRFIGQVLKSVLRPPEMTADNEFMEDDDENWVYGAGIPGAVCGDGRIRTTIYQTKETGRWSSARPPLQNISKRREPDYKRILGDRYTYPLRSIICAPPGYVLVEADYVGAELFGMAVMSGDPRMIEHATYNQLPEDDPNYYDIHSNIAVMAFGLECPPTKAGLAAIGKKHLRIVAKCVPGHVRLQTSEGWLRVDSLCGEVPKKQGVDVSSSDVRVASLHGQTPLLALYNGGQKRCVRVETERGYRLDAATGHHLAVMTSTGKLGFKRARDVRVGDWVVLRTGDDTFGRCLEFPSVEVPKRTNYIELDLPRQFSPDWAALLGLYLAEGSLDYDSLQISLAYEQDCELADQTRMLMRRLFGGRVSETEVPHEVHQAQKKFSISSVKLAAWFRENAPGDSHTKFVPGFVFKWPKKLQSTFMRWLFEGDGSVKRNGSGVSIGYSTASETLARDVQTLLMGFGIETSLAAEKRNGHDGTYWALSLFSNVSRDRFAEQIGFVTSADRGRFESGCISPEFKCDRRVIPCQVEWLRRILPAVASPAKEKCRECTRKRSRVALNPSRLTTILASVAIDKLDSSGAAAYEHLRNLAGLSLAYQRVRSIEDLGVMPVYDVETSAENMHTVCYDGFLTHQSVVFGVAYGRGAKAISLAAKEEGIEVTVDEAQQIVDTIFAMYPGLTALFKECRERAVANRNSDDVAPRWLCGAFGRFRRFPETSDRQVMGELERQAQNFPIQGMIADAVSLAVAELRDYRETAYANGESRETLDYQLCLQVHDAILALVRYEHVPRYVEEVLPLCMCDKVPIYPCSLDGMPTGTGPYTLGIDTGVELHWGIVPLPHELIQVGVDPKFAHWKKVKKGYEHPEAYPGKVWIDGELRVKAK